MRKLKAFIMILVVTLGLLPILQFRVLANPTIVGTTTTLPAATMAVSWPFQRKCFYANGRFWVLYQDGASGRYSTSVDGETWSEPTIVLGGDCGNFMSFWFDGTYVRAVYMYDPPTGYPLLYYHAIPYANGTLNFGNSEPVLSENLVLYWHPFVSVDTDGYAWITYIRQNLTDSTVYPYVVKSTNNDGTWGSVAAGFPHKLSEIEDGNWKSSIVPLTEGKMLAVYGYWPDTVRVKSWNGTHWGSEVETDCTGGGVYHSVVSKGDYGYIVCHESNGHNITYTKYTYETNSLSEEVTVQASTTSSSAPVLGIDTNTNILYCFWAGSPTANCIYYKRCVDETWDTSPTLWITETTLTSNGKITGFYQVWNGKLGLLYMTKDEAPYDIKFGFFNIYSLSVDSLPHAVSFTLNGTSKTTPYSDTLPSLTYEINFTSSFERDGVTWNFKYWDDNETNTNPSRIINLQSNTTLSVTYSAEYSPITYTGYEPVFECALNNMFELNGILEGNDTYRQMLLDSSVYENHGKLQPIAHPYQGPELTWGRMGKALQFDGVDDSVIVANSYSLNITEAITVEFWFMVYNVSKGGANGDQKMLFASNGTNSNGYQWAIELYNGTIRTEVWTESGNCYEKNGTLTVEEGIFYYVGLTYDYRHGYYTVYLHGAPQYRVNTDGRKIRATNGNLYLGSLANTSHWFNGVLDEVRIYPYKRSYKEIHGDARNPIVRFDRFDFTNTGVSTNTTWIIEDVDWTVTEGTKAGYTGFKNNDPSLPWAYVNDTYHHSFLRTIQYVAGFQKYQMYCRIRIDATSMLYCSANYVAWYWNFLRDGRLQVTYELRVIPWNDHFCVEFKRYTPYYGVQNMTTWSIDINQTLFAGGGWWQELPLIVTAWIGPDNKHFSVRLDAQDSRLRTGGDELPLAYNYALVDENLNEHTLQWYDGWVVCGIKVRAYAIGGETSKIQIKSHQLFGIDDLLIIGCAVVIGVCILYLAYQEPPLEPEDFIPEIPEGELPEIPDVDLPDLSLTPTELIEETVKETVNLLSPISEAVEAQVKKTGQSIVDALAGLSHDFIASIGGLASTLVDVLTPIQQALYGIGTPIVQAFISYMEPLVSAVASAGNSLINGLVYMIDSVFGAFGYSQGFSNTLSWLASLGSWFSDSISYAVSMLTSGFKVFGETMGKALNTLNTAFTAFADFFKNMWYILDNFGAGAQSAWDTIRMDLWVTLFFILYPLWLLFLWDREGLGALERHIRFVIDVLGFFALLFIRIVQGFIDVISKLAEMIPVIE